jgi:Protein of unknown function (DUF1566)
MRKILLASVTMLLFGACGQQPEGTTDGDCSDELDNDGDGRYDCEDDGCLAATYCVNQARLVKEAEREKEAERAAQKVNDRKAQADAEAQAASPIFNLEDLVVQRGTNDSDIDWKDANTYCEKLKLLGKANWRLPTAEEAVKIVNSDQLGKGSSYVMWTSSKKGKRNAFIVGMSGAVNDLGKKYKGQCRARCVNTEQ